MLDMKEHGTLMRHFETAQEPVTSTLEVPSGTVDIGLVSFQIAEGLLRGIQVQMDNGTIQELSGALRGADSVTATKVQEDKQKQKEKKDRESRRLQDLLDQIAGIDAQIDGINKQIELLEEKIDALGDAMEALANGEDTDDVMDRPHVEDAIRDWERRTGKKFDPEAENAADVLAAILGTQQDEYGNDIAALETEKGKLEDEREGLVKDIQQRDADFEARSTDIREGSRNEAAEKYDTSDNIGAVSTQEVLVADGREMQDDHSDNQVNSDEDVVADATGFGGFGMLANDAASPKLAEAQKDLGQQWQTASVDTTFDEPEQTSGLKLDTSPIVGV